MAEVKQLKKVDGDGFLTIEEAAKALNIQPAVVRNYLHMGKLTTYKFKTLTLLKVEEVEAWKERQKPR
jgi:excisionase family DNA binding protein